MRRVNVSNQREPEDVQGAGEAERVAGLVRRIYKLMDRTRGEQERAGGLTRPQANVLELLLEQPGLSVREIAGALELSHGTVSGIVSRLETAGLLSRLPDPADRRVMRHHVSEAVRDYAREHSRAPERSPLRAALERASQEDRSLILRALTRLHDLIEAR